MDIKEIQNLIKFVARSGATEVNLETEDFKIVIKTTAEVANMDHPIVQHVAQVVPGQMPLQAAPLVPVPQAAAPVAIEDDSKYVIIRSPMIGTMYRRPTPDKELFVQVGSEVHKGDTVCIIEAMKLFNEIESEVSGKIVKVLIDDQSPVEYDQPLFVVDPA